MGIPIERETFTPHEYAAFSQRLTQQLAQLRELLSQPGFGEGAASIGAEVEMHLVDPAAQPACVSEAVLQAAADPRCALEAAAFNFEVNARPVPLAGRSLSALRGEFEDLLMVVRRAAAICGARVALIGTLPTLSLAQLHAGLVTDTPRYRAMSRALQAARGGPFEARIDGRECLRAALDDLAVEGANASLQVHLRVAPQAFANVYNAAQLAAGPLLAVSGNSPFFAGKSLWDETRIALFKQAVDTRVDEAARLTTPSRVTFGQGWLPNAHFAFEESVALFPPLLPVVAPVHPSEHGVPALRELRLHHGTCWNWNRAIYDPADGGHLRIEHRVTASGPTVSDMIANAAFTLGLSLALAPAMPRLLPAMPFTYAERNLYRAAKYGLQAELAWPAAHAPSPRTRNARELVLELLPQAQTALVQAGVAADEAAAQLAIIEARARSGKTGAAVQRAMVETYARTASRERALAQMLERYLKLAADDVPVHRWNV